MTEYGITGLKLDVRATLRTVKDYDQPGVLSDLLVIVDGREVGSVVRERVNRPRPDGSGGVTSALRWCCYSRNWAPEWATPIPELGIKPGTPCQIGEGFDDRMEAAIALLEVWDREGRP